MTFLGARRVSGDRLEIGTCISLVLIGESACGAEIMGRFQLSLHVGVGCGVVPCKFYAACGVHRIVVLGQFKCWTLQENFVPVCLRTTALQS